MVLRTGVFEEPHSLLGPPNRLPRGVFSGLEGMKGVCPSLTECGDMGYCHYVADFTLSRSIYFGILNVIYSTQYNFINKYLWGRNLALQII